MNIDYLEEFLHLAETLSFTKTAERFYTSRSVISRHVASMEGELGVRLLNRDRHSVSLTREGEVFCAGARAVVRDFNQLVESTRNASEGHEPAVRIGYLRNAARPFIVHFANYFREKYPHVRLAYSCMKYDELCQSMAEGRIDLALSMDFAGELEGRYKSMFVYEDKLYATMSSSDPLAAKAEGVECADLTGRKVMMSESLSCAGLNEYLIHAFGPKSAFISFDSFDDADLAQLRLRVDGSIALRSGYNAFLSGDDTVTVDIKDVDLSFKANAYYRGNLPARTVSICKDVVSECRRYMDEDVQLAL